MHKVYITFSGARYHNTTKSIVENAPRLGADKVIVYDDHWLFNQKADKCREADWLFKTKGTRGCGWFFWKSVVMEDALARVNDGDVVLFTDADTFPIHDLNPIFKRAADEGMMLFAANGWLQKQWCRRETFRAMGIEDDDPKYYEAQHGVARFIALRKGDPRVNDFLADWYRYCLRPDCNTFELTPGIVQHKDFREHRCEQAIMTNLAHKLGLKLYREACQFGNSFPGDWDLYPQTFTQVGDYSFSPVPCSGSAFRNV